MKIEEYKSIGPNHYNLMVDGTPARVFKVSKEIVGKFRVGYYLERYFGDGTVGTEKITDNSAQGYLYDMPKSTDLLFDDTDYTK